MNSRKTHNLKVKQQDDWNLHCFDYFFRYRENIVIPNNLGPPKIKTNEEKMIESVVESCFFKSFMACVLGRIVENEFQMNRI